MDHIGRDTVIESKGRRFTLSRYTRQVLRRFIRHANEVLPHPLDEAKAHLDGFPPHLQEKIVNDALERMRERINFTSADIRAYLMSPDGEAKLLQLLLLKHHPEMTVEAAEELYEDVIEEHGMEYMGERFKEASGVMPEEQSEALEAIGLLPKKKQKTSLSVG